MASAPDATQRAQWNESRQPLLYGVTSVLLLLCNSTVVLRLWASQRRSKKLQIDDVFMIIAALFSNTLGAMLLAVTVKGVGLHQWRVIAADPEPPIQVVNIFKIIWAYAVLNGFCFLTVKLSILLFFRRLFFVHKWFRLAWWINLVWAILWTVGSTIFYIFQCTPVEFYWTRIAAPFQDSRVFVDPNGHCTSSLAAIGSPIILNTISDFFILLLPIPVFLKLNTTLTKRLRLVALFAIGTIATAAGFVRFALIFQESVGDQTYGSVEFLLWGNIEETMGIVCANMPFIISLIDSLRGGTGDAATAEPSRAGFRAGFRPDFVTPGVSGRSLGTTHVGIYKALEDDEEQTRSGQWPLKKWNGHKGNSEAASHGNLPSDAIQVTRTIHIESSAAEG